jgi:hypothetical protein
MKSKIEIEIKKIRKQLRIYGLSEEEKQQLRQQLKKLKLSHKKEKLN